jgi:hypothetical protein
MWFCDSCGFHQKPTKAQSCPTCKDAMVRELPAIFTGESIPKIDNGLKTQTRRVVDESKLKVMLPRPVCGDWPFDRTQAAPGPRPAMMNRHGAVSVEAPCPGGAFYDKPKGDPIWLGVKPDEFRWTSPYGHAGGRLWVKETWAEVPWSVAYKPEFDGGRIRAIGPLPAELRYCIYAADFEQRPEQLSKWTSPIFMPRWASRYLLDVVDVRVERLQAITWSDIRAEGIDCPVHDFPGGFCIRECPDLRQAFAQRWDALNARRGWAWSTNPWVYVVTFERHRRRQMKLFDEQEDA